MVQLEKTDEIGWSETLPVIGSNFKDFVGWNIELRLQANGKPELEIILSSPRDQGLAYELTLRKESQRSVRFGSKDVSFDDFPNKLRGVIHTIVAENSKSYAAVIHEIGNLLQLRFMTVLTAPDASSSFKLLVYLEFQRIRDPVKLNEYLHRLLIKEQVELNKRKAFLQQLKQKESQIPPACSSDEQNTNSSPLMSADTNVPCLLCLADSNTKYPPAERESHARSHAEAIAAAQGTSIWIPSFFEMFSKVWVDCFPVDTKRGVLSADDDDSNAGQVEEQLPSVSAPLTLNEPSPAFNAELAATTSPDDFSVSNDLALAKQPTDAFRCGGGSANLFESLAISTPQPATSLVPTNATDRLTALTSPVSDCGSAGFETTSTLNNDVQVERTSLEEAESTVVKQKACKANTSNGGSPGFHTILSASGEEIIDLASDSDDD